MFQNTELNAAHHLRFLVETLWSPKTMSLIKIPKVWILMTAIIFCLCILWKTCITWHFWATNRKLTFSWKITPLGAIPPLNKWYVYVIWACFLCPCSGWACSVFAHSFLAPSSQRAHPFSVLQSVPQTWAWAEQIASKFQGNKKLPSCLLGSICDISKTLWNEMREEILIV